MCGIAGIFSYHVNAPQMEREELMRMRESMISRGPDGEGLWVSDRGDVGLAHRRLSIIDLSEAASQPMLTTDGHYCIVFNGEIYNYRALRAELERKGYRFSSQSDTEVLLHLYAERGVDMVHALRGMYAFAIWDEKRKGMLMARDPFGIKPLYYADDGISLRFASQVKALLQSKKIDVSPEPAGHVGFLLLGNIPEPYTLYKGIRALPAGSMIWADESGIHKPVCFFNIADKLAQAEGNASNFCQIELVKQLHNALLDSVQHHLIADVPVGIFLSAGIDSATLMALASEAGLGVLHTITLGFNEYKGSKNDETPLAEMVAKHYGCAHQTRWVSREDFQSAKGHLLVVMDQPTIDGVNSYFVSKVAAEAGLKVAISGLGGDELFGGYPSFRDIPRMVNLLSPLGLVWKLGKTFRVISAPVLKHFTSPKYAGLLEYGNTVSGAYFLRRGLFMPWELPEIIGDDMSCAGWQELQPLIRLEQTIHGIMSDHTKVSALEMTWYMRNQLLRDADWAGMAHSLEIRVPLVDIDLFQNVISLSSPHKHLSKRDLANVPIKPLPGEILHRSKSGFSIPVHDWLTEKSAAHKGVSGRGLRRWALEVYDAHRQYA